MPEEPEDLDRVKARADALLAEEQEAGSDDPLAQAAAILEESDERQFERDEPGGEGLERRRSEDTVELPDVSEGGSDATGQDAPKP